MKIELNKIYEGNALDVLKTFEDNNIDAIVTDPPYGYSFMNKEWDKGVIGVDIWKECLRVLKPGSFAAILSSPRQDVLARMICNLQDAGFKTDFTSIYWTYASGFPKAANVSKLVDKLGYENHQYSQLSKELCNYIKTAREKKRLTKTQLGVYFMTSSTRINHGGCVSNWEMGSNIPTMRQWEILKEILQLDN